MFSDVWSENAALFERLMKIHSYPPIPYYGFNISHNAILVVNRTVQTENFVMSDDSYKIQVLYNSLRRSKGVRDSPILNRHLLSTPHKMHFSRVNRALLTGNSTTLTKFK